MTSKEKASSDSTPLCITVLLRCFAKVFVSFFATVMLCFVSTAMLLPQCCCVLLPQCFGVLLPQCFVATVLVFSFLRLFPPSSGHRQMSKTEDTQKHTYKHSRLKKANIFLFVSSVPPSSCNSSSPLLLTRGGGARSVPEANSTNAAVLTQTHAENSQTLRNVEVFCVKRHQTLSYCVCVCV